MSYSTQALIQKLESLGLSPKKALGQNFLISENVIAKICTATLNLSENLIEIGPGLGALTETLLPAAKSYQVIELDRAFSQMWRDRGVQVTEVDALRFSWDQLPDKAKMVLVSNLPYQISASLVIDRSLDQETFKGMVLMFQKEVAQRITAKSASEDYGLLSVIAQTFWNVDVVSEAGPKDFYPPPRVASRVLRFQPKIVSIERQKFLSFVKCAFAHRRKLLTSNLTAWKKIDKSELEQQLLALNKKSQARAEELNPAEFVELFLALSKVST